MILCLAVRVVLAKARRGLQFKHVVYQPTNDREGGEQNKGNEQHGLSTENIAELGVYDEKACLPRIGSILYMGEKWGACTSVGQKVGGDDPTTLVEPMESIRDAHE